MYRGSFRYTFLCECLKSLPFFRNKIIRIKKFRTNITKSRKFVSLLASFLFFCEFSIYMTTKIAIYSQTLSPRIEYVFKLIFKDLLNCEAVCFFDNATAFQKSNLGIKISYGTFFDAQTIFFAKETE